VSELKVTIASGIYPPDKGGPAQFASAFSQWLASQGIPTTVVSLTDADGYSLTEGNFRLILISRKNNLLLRYFYTAKNIIQSSKKHNLIINGVFLETLIASLVTPLKYIAKVPGDIVWERARNQGETALGIDEYQGTETFSKRIMRWFFVASLKRSRAILAPSQHMSELISSWGVSPRTIHVVRNSVDLDLFSLTKQPEKKFDLITVCRLTPWKGVSEIIKEASSRNLSLCVIGSGPELAPLKKQVKDSGADVTFLGEVEQRLIPNFLNQSRCFILNSSYEGSPHALLEAMALGSLVIARDSTGTREVVRDLDNGILCGERRTLGAAIDIAFDKSRDIESIKKAAASTIQNEYERDKIFRNILDLIRDSV
jgi:glycosyltransferase involved in cell wall biosynthesis